MGDGWWALAKAATIEAKVQVRKKRRQAFSKEKEAQDAEMAVTKPEALLNQSSSEGAIKVVHAMYLCLRGKAV